MYRVIIVPSAVEDLAKLKAFDRAMVMQGIEEQLPHSPTNPSRHRKILEGVRPRFEAVPPIWQLRIGDHRVFHDVDEGTRVVHVRAVREKPPHRTTEEIV